MTDLRPKYLARRLRRDKPRVTWVIRAPGPLTQEQADHARRLWAKAQRTGVPVVMAPGWGVEQYPPAALLPHRALYRRTR